MQLMHSLTTALPLSRLTAYTIKGKYHTFGESLPMPVPPPTTTLSSPSRTIKSSDSHSTTRSNEYHPHVDHPHSNSQTTIPPLSQESKHNFLHDLPNSAWIDAHLNPSPSTTVLEVSLALPGTTLHMSRVAPEINLNPGDKHQGSRYLSGSLVWSGSYDKTATSPDIDLGGTWEGVVASSSTWRAVITIAAASTTPAEIGESTKSESSSMSPPKTSSVRSSSTFSTQTTNSETISSHSSVKSSSSADETSSGSLNNSPITITVTVERKPSTTKSSTESPSTKPSTKSSTTKTAEKEASTTESSTEPSRTKASSTESFDTEASSTQASSSETSSQLPETSAATSKSPASATTSTTTAESGKSPWWHRLFRRNDNQEVTPNHISTSPSTTSQSPRTRTANGTVSFIKRFSLGHSKVLTVTPASKTTSFGTRILMGHSEVLPVAPQATGTDRDESR